MKGIEYNQADIAASFQKAVTDVLVANAMHAVEEFHVDKLAIAGGVASNSALRAAMKELSLIHIFICRKFMNMYVTRDICQIYNWFLEDYGFPALPDMPPERRVLEYEDVYPILYLKYSLTEAGQRKNIRHLVIDEMQDYSYLQYVLLAKMFSCNMTIPVSYTHLKYLVEF